jgi:hypothetical protein
VTVNLVVAGTPPAAWVTGRGGAARSVGGGGCGAVMVGLRRSM